MERSEKVSRTIGVIDHAEEALEKLHDDLREFGTPYAIEWDNAVCKFLSKMSDWRDQLSGRKTEDFEAAVRRSRYRSDD